jgi:hypothetical protein
MTFRCEACAIDWAPAHTRGGACPGCGSGTKRITTAEPDSDAAAQYRRIVAAETDLQRKLTLYLRFDEFYEQEWPTHPARLASAVEAVGWVGL